MNYNYEVVGDEYIDAGINSSKFKKVLKNIGINAKIIRKVSVAMYEAEINMVIHANGGVINAEITSEQIKVELIDHGPGIEDLDKAMQPGWSTATPKAREMGFGAGMGLPNIKKNSDHINIKSEIGVGTTVTIIFNL